MNKDVIYIEPEDDITDIITKIENSKEKIIALVPPKKASVFRSIVNIKLIAKAGANASKTVVLVTTDPSIIKLAGVTKLPVTKNLQSAPTIPETEAEEEIETTSKETVMENEEPSEEAEKTEEKEDEAKKEEDEKEEDTKGEEKSEKDERDDKNEEKPEKKKKAKKLTGNWFIDHKKWLIFGGIGGVLLILILVWAFGVAPAADVTVAVRTTTTNFSESATFTTKLEEENVSEGKLYLTEKKTETKKELEFEATGKKNVGEKATGSVVVYKYFRGNESVAVGDGAAFVHSGLRFIATEDVSFGWDGNDLNKCGNKDQASLVMSGCLIYARVSVEAAEPGEQYNVQASKEGWATTAKVSGVYSDEAMSGGSDKTIMIVSQADIDAALAKIADENASTEATRRESLLATIEEGSFIINSSYKQSMSDPVASPKLGEEVEEGKKATLTVVTTDSIYIVDKTKVEEFISEKAKLADNYKIYKMNDPFIENFTAVGEGYIGKIKTSFVSGPKVTENDVIDIIKGKGLGEARAALLDAFSGIDSNKTKINVSYPWVFSIPSNPTKITVTIDVEE